MKKKKQKQNVYSDRKLKVSEKKKWGERGVLSQFSFFLVPPKGTIRWALGTKLKKVKMKKFLKYIFTPIKVR